MTREDARPSSIPAVALPAGGRGPVGRLGFEVEVAARMMADNASSGLLPPLLFTAVACSYRGITGLALAEHLAASAALFTLYIYVFDAANQAGGAAEDSTNKPHRPVPSGLITAEGLLRRFWWAMALYTLFGCLTGTLVWVLSWQAVVVGLNLVSRPRQYFVVKPVAMLLGTIAQLAAAWQLVTPLDSVGWSWVLVIAIAFNVPLVFEDVRDMEGDRRIGRRTIPLMVGAWPVRIWFAATMGVLPIVLQVRLFGPSHASVVAVLGCAVLITAMSWTAAARSVLARTVRADRATYLLYTFTYCVTLACGLVLL